MEPLLLTLALAMVFGGIMAYLVKRDEKREKSKHS